MELIRTTNNDRRGVTYNLQYVLEKIASRHSVTNICDALVSVKGVRLQTYSEHGIVCSNCGLEGKFFAVERTINQPKHPYHLNLYAERNGKEVLMTCDHTLARSLGGEHHTRNTTPMCTTCNGAKSRIESAKVRELIEAGTLPSRHKKGKVRTSTGETNGKTREQGMVEPARVPCT